jgi:hypothetical protein
MGSSLYLSGGVQSTDRLVKTIAQSSTFKIGDVVRFDMVSGQYDNRCVSLVVFC